MPWRILADRSSLALVVALVLIFSADRAIAANTTPVQRITSLQEGRKLTVHLKDGRTATGRRGKLSGESFTLDPLNQGNTAPQEIRFDQVESVTTGMTAARKAGVIAGVVLLASLFIGLVAGSRV